MSVGIYNWKWSQGEDLVMPMVYRLGPPGAEQPVDLSAYSLRMDVVRAGKRIFTFNSSDISDTDVDTVGPADNEATLGADGTIKIVVSRALTLEGGPVYPLIRGNDVELDYDIFLRSPDNMQRKFLKGKITVRPSYTQWK